MLFGFRQPFTGRHYVALRPFLLIDLTEMGEMEFADCHKRYFIPSRITASKARLRNFRIQEIIVAGGPPPDGLEASCYVNFIDHDQNAAQWQ
jgi:hypothetical protein